MQDELLRDADLAPAKKTKPPSKWRNHYRYLLNDRLLGVTWKCATCRVRILVPALNEIFTEHCVTYPSRDIAETIGLQFTEIDPDLTEYIEPYPLDNP